MKHPYLEMIASRAPVIYDGAGGTEIQKAEPRPTGTTCPICGAPT